MILKIIEDLSKRRNLILAILALPLMSVFFLGDYKLQVLPPFEYVEYEVKFKVPGSIASYIEDKVTLEAERVFNGLPGVISIESWSTHEGSTVRLRFEKGNNPNTILLFIQEKMDRLKLMLPSEVKQIMIEEIKRVTPPDMTMTHKDGFLVNEVINSFSEIQEAIVKTTPELRDITSFNLEFNVNALAENNISIDQVWKALQLNGLTYRLGKKNDINYFLEMEFENIERVRAVLIGARGNRPLKLADVATISPRLTPKIKFLDIWFDKTKISQGNLKKHIEKSFPGVTVRFTKLALWFHYLKKPVITFFILLAIQLLTFYLTFKKSQALIPAVVFDVLFTIHYFFWIVFFRSEVTLIDITSYFLCFIIGSIFLLVLIARIKTYFMPSSLKTFIQRNLAQASLFSMAEYFPTFIMLFILSFLFSIPFLLSDINIPSQAIIKQYVYFGMPVLLVILAIIPILTHLKWVTKSEATSVDKNSRMSHYLSMHYIWILVLFFIISAVLWYYTPYGLNFSEDKITKKSIKVEEKFDFYKNLDIYRGYEKSLYYQLVNLNGEDRKGFVYSEDNMLKKNWMMAWNVTPNGLSQLPKYDISVFQKALSEIQQEGIWGTWRFGLDAIPLGYNPLNLKYDTFSQLLVGAKDKSDKPLRLGLILEPKITLYPSQVFRSQLTRVNEVTLSNEITGGNFLHKVDNDLKPSPKTKKWFDQHKIFLKNKWIVMVFTFILMSLYLNSFFRGGALTIFAFAASGAISIWKFAMSSTYHLDSLWFDWVPMWVVLSVILLLSRMVDVERLRGSDRGLVLPDMERNFSYVVKSVIPFCGLSFITLGAMDFLPWSLSSYFYYEGVLVGVISLLLGYLSFYYLFRLFYISGDEFVEGLTFRFFGWFIKLRYKYLKS